MSKQPRLFLSPPHMGGEELKFVEEAFASNYIAPLGPMVDAFEKEFAEYTGIPHCLALSSGTAAMHLALCELGVGPGDEVLASTLTFIGSVNSATYLGASLAFIDSDAQSWNMDPALLAEELAERARLGKLPKVVIPTDLYGQCANLKGIQAVCAPYGIPVVSDAAEAMGAFRREQGEGVSWKLEDGGRGTEDRGRRTEDGRRGTENGGRRTEDGGRGTENGRRRTEDGGRKTKDGRRELATLDSRLSTLPSPGWVHAGKGARAAVFSFNGNKIITTSGGGMLASEDKAFIDHARKLSQQAREPLPHYEHIEIGYNYRMSNVVAAIGRGQLRVLDERVRRKREIFAAYQQLLGDLPGIEFMPEAAYGQCNRWLTVALIRSEQFGAAPEQVRLALDAEGIESRPVWKPMHLQPVFRGCRVRGGKVSEQLFRNGLCLPSGTAMTDADIERVVKVVRGQFRKGTGGVRNGKGARARQAVGR